MSAIVAPMVVVFALSVPKLGQGDMGVDTGWYSAISVQGYRVACGGPAGDGATADELSAHGDDRWGLWSLAGPRDPSGSPVVPYFNKPPLVFWIHGLFLWVFGVTTVVARLPSVIAAALCAGLVGWMVMRAARVVMPSNSAGEGETPLASRGDGLRKAPHATGALAGVILALTWEFTRHGRAFSLDVWLTLWLVGAAGCFMELMRWGEPDRPAGARAGRVCARWTVLGGVLMGCALMTKPFVGLVACVPMLVASWGRWGVVRGVVGMAVVGVLVAAPWHASMVAVHGDVFTDQYIGRQVMERASGGGAAMNEGAGSVLYYFKELARGYWPWLATVVLACVAMARGEFRGRAAVAARFAIVWMLVWVVGLSLFADKRPRYLLVVYPMGAWVSAWWMVYAAPGLVKRSGVWLARWAAPVAVVLGLVLAVAPVRVHRGADPQWAALYEWMGQEGVSPWRSGSGAGVDERWLWAGGLDGSRGARLFLEYGAWPRVTRDLSGRVVAVPPSGSLILYHSRDGWKPGPGEHIVFTAGDLTVTRLEGSLWQPIAVVDPGEERPLAAE